MKFSFGYISSFETFSVYMESARIFEHLLAAGLYRYHTEMVEDWAMYFICVSPSFQKFHKKIRPRYYADRILTDKKSITPKVHVFKLLDMDFLVDYDKYVKAQTEEECLKVLAQEFMQCIETMTYPVVLRKTFDRKAFEQRARDILTEHGLL